MATRSQLMRHDRTNPPAKAETEAKLSQTRRPDRRRIIIETRIGGQRKIGNDGSKQKDDRQ
jgi:hypothetical protein